MSRRAFRSKHGRSNWQRSAKKRGASGMFGGKIKTQDEIAAMDARNALAEEVAFASFEANIDQELKDV